MNAVRRYLERRRVERLMLALASGGARRKRQPSGPPATRGPSSPFSP
jgi:hypothetical protein